MCHTLYSYFTYLIASSTSGSIRAWMAIPVPSTVVPGTTLLFGVIESFIELCVDVLLVFGWMQIPRIYVLPYPV